MVYIWIVILICLLPVIDLITSLTRLKISGITKGYKLLFFGIGFDRKYGCSFVGNTTKKILIVGDSTAVGPGADPEDTIAGRLAKKFGIDVTNLGVNGATTEEVITQIQSVAHQKFHLVIIHTGNNDIWRFTDLKKLEKDYNQLLDQASLISGKVMVFRGGNFALMPVFPLIFRWIWGRRSKKVRELFKKDAERKAVIYVERFIDTNESMKDVFFMQPYNYYAWDLLHLNGNGYKVWFDYLLEEMKKSHLDLAIQK